MSLRQFIFVLLTLIVFPGCAQDRSTPMPLIVAHRGASHLAPENTLAAFNLAWELDADLVEGDFYLTKDGAIVCHHDDTTLKTAGVDRFVEEQTLEELRILDVGRWKDHKWEGEHIPTLSEVLDTVPEGHTFLIEIKSDKRIVPTLIETMLASKLGLDQMIVICFDEDVISEIERLRPDIKTFWLSSFDTDDAGGWTPTLYQLLETAKRINTDGLDLEANLEVLDVSFVSTIHAEGLEVHTWTVNDKQIAQRLRKLKVDSITTDRPRWLRKQLRDW